MLSLPIGLEVGSCPVARGADSLSGRPDGKACSDKHEIRFRYYEDFIILAVFFSWS